MEAPCISSRVCVRWHGHGHMGSLKLAGGGGEVFPPRKSANAATHGLPREPLVEHVRAHRCSLIPFVFPDCGFEEYRPVLGNGPVWVCPAVPHSQVQGGQHIPSWWCEPIQGQRVCLLVLPPAPRVTWSVVVLSGAESSTRVPSIPCIGVRSGEDKAAHWGSGGTGWFSVPK